MTDAERLRREGLDALIAKVKALPAASARDHATLLEVEQALAALREAPYADTERLKAEHARYREALDTIYRGSQRDWWAAGIAADALSSEPVAAKPPSRTAPSTAPTENPSK